MSRQGSDEKGSGNAGSDLESAVVDALRRLETRRMSKDRSRCPLILRSSRNRPSQRYSDPRASSESSTVADAHYVTVTGVSIGWGDIVNVFVRMTVLPCEDHERLYEEVRSGTSEVLGSIGHSVHVTWIDRASCLHAGGCEVWTANDVAAPTGTSPEERIWSFLADRFQPDDLVRIKSISAKHGWGDIVYVSVVLDAPGEARPRFTAEVREIIGGALSGLRHSITMYRL